MTPGRHDQIESLYHRALEKKESQRDEFLREACAGDDALRREVESLLGRAGSVGLTSAPTEERPAKTPAKAAAKESGTVPTPGPSDLPRSRRAPWWMYVVAASYVALFALIPYLVIWGPADLLGLAADFEDGTMLVRAAEPDSLPARAGVRPGDRVVAIDGRPMRRIGDWTAVNANLEVGRAQRWEILRDQERLELEVTPERANWRNRLAGGYISYSGLALISFAVGLFVGFRRPGDPAAMIGAWFIATAAIAFGLPNGWAVAWRQVPVPFQVSFWIPEISRFVLEGIFLSLFVIFPRRLFQARWPWILIWAPVLVTLPWRVAQFYAVIYHPSEALVVPAWVNQAANLRTIVYLLAGIGVLVVSYRRMLDAHEKRRVRVLMLGTAVGIGAAIATIWFHNFAQLDTGSLLRIAFVHPLTLACPLAFAYAILRHRVFDIQVILRQGLQYALARGAVVGVLPALGALLLLDLALNSQETIATILQDRGWIYASFGGLALVAYWQRKPWLEALDRKFFREAYDQERILLGLIESVKESTSLRDISVMVSTEIGTALHPVSTYVFYREPNRPDFSVGSSSSGEAQLPRIREDSALVRAMGRRSTPLEVSDPYIGSELPVSEKAWLDELRVDLVVPMKGSVLPLAGLFLLGHKMSEEPYSPTDKKLLQTIAGQVAVVCENLWLHARAGRDSRMRRDVLAHLEKKQVNLVKECPACGRCFDRSDEVCPDDRNELSLTLPVERVLEDRYRLERILGRGGMGAVYEATDTRLRRSVAVKIMMGHLFGQPKALRRFEREAQASANLNHPNIIEVHDYGRIGDDGAFLVIELIRGMTMRGELDRRGRIAPPVAAEWFDQVLDGLSAAHEHGIIHRDLKPENIMISGQGADSELIKILDFGLAKAKWISTTATGLTVPGAVLGTYAYMSPEQLGGNELDERSDLFSVGIMVVETITGSHPFRGRTSAEMLHAILHDPVHLEGEAEAIRTLENVLEKCLAKDRANRFASAKELRHALIPALQGSPSPSMQPRAGRPLSPSSPTRTKRD